MKDLTSLLRGEGRKDEVKLRATYVLYSEEPVFRSLDEAQLRLHRCLQHSILKTEAVLSLGILYDIGRKAQPQITTLSTENSQSVYR